MIIDDDNKELTLIIPIDNNFSISENLNIKKFTMYMKFDDFLDMKNTIEKQYKINMGLKND